MPGERTTAIPEPGRPHEANAPSTPATGQGPGQTTDRLPLSATTTMLVAIALGLGGGYLDDVFIVLKKYTWNEFRYFETARDFPWSVPTAHAAILLVAGVLLAAVNLRRPGRIPGWAAVWMLTTLALWGAFLRLPLHGAASLILAAGLARMLGRTVAVQTRRPRRAARVLAALVVPLVPLAALTSGRQVLREWRAAGALPPAPARARNVLLIVWDTVSAQHLSLYGYPRDTTPGLRKWAAQGVRYDSALAPAPWTLPSHGCFFTGQWPYRNGTLGHPTLEAPEPTLAEYLAARGYQTAGFSANTSLCSYETGLDRGFARFEDYPLTPGRWLGRTVPGRWFLEMVVGFGRARDRKWIRTQSRDGRENTEAFLSWLDRRRTDRPFFAFLNYFDAHSPYLPPPGYLIRFENHPRNARDYRLLTDFYLLNKDLLDNRDIRMAYDAYDSCIASLDDELGRLLAALAGRGLLDETLVVIASDHGEAFGNNRVYGHGSSLHLDQVAVPLVILAPDAPRGAVVDEPVSLRDLPATVADQLGLAAGSPFPGRSLASFWRRQPGEAAPRVSPALSANANATLFQPQAQDGPGRRGLQLSLAGRDWHYIRESTGAEQLYNLRTDPQELVNLAGSAAGADALGSFRDTLLRVLTEDRGSIEMERLVLTPYRRWLEALGAGTAPPGPDSPGIPGAAGPGS